MCGTQLSSVTEEGLKNPGSCLETQKERKQNQQKERNIIAEVNEIGNRENNRIG